MRPLRPRRPLRIAVAAAVVLALSCSSNPDTVNTRGGSYETPSSGGPARSSTSDGTRAERLVRARFVRAEPPARDARVIFEVTNQGERPIAILFSVVYYYDRRGQLMKRSAPFSADETLGPHETREVALDWVSEMPRTAALAEAEIDEVKFADGSRWSNPALAPVDRPRGGVTE